jgi:hypothetical protein
MTTTTLEPITEAAAVDALLAAAGEPAGDGIAYITAEIGTMPARMPVVTAIKMIRGAFDNARAEQARVGWAPDLDRADGLGLVVLDAGGALWRFAARPVADADLDREPITATVVRPDLRIVPDAPGVRPAAG